MKSSSRLSQTGPGYTLPAIGKMHRSSQGVPAIVTNVGGMPELAENGSAGIVVPPSNIGALADAIRTLYNDRDRAKELGRLGQKRIQEVFNVTSTVEKIHDVFTELMKTKGLST